MNYPVVFRYTILTVSGLAMIAGILIMAGVLVPRNLPEQYGVLIGVVVFLYGAYRFAIAFFRRGVRP
jgi:hypothetical protein